MMFAIPKQEVRSATYTLEEYVETFSVHRKGARKDARIQLVYERLINGDGLAKLPALDNESTIQTVKYTGDRDIGTASLSLDEVKDLKVQVTDYQGNYCGYDEKGQVIGDFRLSLRGRESRNYYVPRPIKTNIVIVNSLIDKEEKVC